MSPLPRPAQKPPPEVLAKLAEAQRRYAAGEDPDPLDEQDTFEGRPPAREP